MNLIISWNYTITIATYFFLGPSRDTSFSRGSSKDSSRDSSRDYSSSSEEQFISFEGICLTNFGFYLCIERNFVFVIRHYDSSYLYLRIESNSRRLGSCDENGTKTQWSHLFGGMFTSLHSKLFHFLTSNRFQRYKILFILSFS